MRQINTKINKNNIRTAIRVFSFLAVLPFILPYSGVKAEDLSTQSVIAVTNEERALKNLPLLVENEVLNKAAALKAQDMLTNNYFSHTSPAGLAPWHWIKKSGYEYEFAGENLAINFTSASEQGKAWMNSKTHRENILNKQYTEVGVAVVSGQIKGKKSYVTVQLFGKPVVPVITKKNQSTESTFNSVPMVKGVQTEMIEAGASTLIKDYLAYYQSVYQTIKTSLVQNQIFISQTVRELALILILMSLTAPGIVFVSFSFREIYPRTGHLSSG